MGLNDIMNIARSGLTVSQNFIQTTGNNITNVNTPGYSRQRVDVKTLGGVGNPNGIGASIAGINRVHDGFLESQANKYRGTYSFLEGKELVINQLEVAMDELDDNGINRAFSDMFNSFRGLSTNPSGMSERQMVAERGDQLANRINQSYKNLTSIQTDLNYDIKVLVQEANGLIEELGALNREITIYSKADGETEAAALMDRRDQVVRSLHEMLDISTFTDDNGAINVTMANKTLVEGVNTGSLQASGNPMVSIQMTTSGGTTVDITSHLANNSERGKLSGFLFERDVLIESTKSKLDELTYNVYTQINAIHNAAYGLDGNTGRDYFTGVLVEQGAAENIRFNTDLTDNLDWIAAAEDPLSANGDNRAAMAIIDLQDDQTTMGTSSFQEYFVALVGEISNDLATIQKEQDYNRSVLDQADAFKNSVSGVSIDEEMVNLIQFQRSFEASAKMIQTVDEMLNIALSLKR